MAKSKPKKRRSSPGRSPTTRRRRGGGGSRRGSAYMELAKTAAAAAGGFVATQLIVDKFAPPAWKTGDGRIAAKAAAGLSLYLIGKRVAPSLGRGAAIGGLTSAGLDLIAKFTAKSGVAGLGGQGFTDGRLPGFAGDGDAAMLAQAARDLGIS